MENIDTRCVTHPVHPGEWIVEARLYGDHWSKIAVGNLFECVQHANWMAGLTPASP